MRAVFYIFAFFAEFSIIAVQLVGREGGVDLHNARLFLNINVYCFTAAKSKSITKEIIIIGIHAYFIFLNIHHHWFKLSSIAVITIAFTPQSVTGLWIFVLTFLFHFTSFFYVCIPAIVYFISLYQSPKCVPPLLFILFLFTSLRNVYPCCCFFCFEICIPAIVYPISV